MKAVGRTWVSLGESGPDRGMRSHDGDQSAGVV